MQKQEMERNLTKSLIFDAAMKVFMEKGIASTIVEDILKEASISRGTFYKYYNSKEDILLEFKNKHVYEGTTIGAVIKDLFPNFTKLSPNSKLEILFEVIPMELTEPIKNSIAYQSFFSPTISNSLGLDYKNLYNKTIEIWESVFRELGYTHPKRMAKIVETFISGYILNKHIENIQDIDLDIDNVLTDVKNLIKTLNFNELK